MKSKTDEKRINKLQNNITEALSKLDLKGTDEKVTCAMSIVYEAFQLYSDNCDFTAKELYVAAISE